MLKINVNSELIRKFSEIIKRILKKIEAGEYEKALTDIDGAFKDFFRLGSKFFNALTEENLLDMVKTNNIIDVDKCIIISKLLLEEGRALEKLYKDNESFFIYQKSLYLYIEAYIHVEEEVELEEYFQDIEILLSTISDYKLTIKLQKQIVKYYFKDGKYDIAENLLYEILEEEDYTQDSLVYVLKFYNDLLTKDDQELIKANLPREEVLDSKNAIEKKLTFSSL